MPILSYRVLFPLSFWDYNSCSITGLVSFCFDETEFMRSERVDLDNEHWLEPFDEALSIYCKPVFAKLVKLSLTGSAGF